MVFKGFKGFQPLHPMVVSPNNSTSHRIHDLKKLWEKAGGTPYVPIVAFRGGERGYCV